MAEPFKNWYNEQTLNASAQAFKAAYKAFEAEAFVAFVMDESWDELELKGRWRKITLGLGEFLPKDYHKALAIIDAVLDKTGPDDFLAFVPPDFVELYGQDEDNWGRSMLALKTYTPYWSAEFAVRPFIIKHEKRMMAQMRTWSKSKNEHVRRLSSEGCRPQLPWGQALESFKKDPSPVLLILEQLKADPSPYVRKSVANNLNDISKTHPDLVIELAKQWQGKDEYTNWIIKHGCRTLLKKGSPEALALFGFGNSSLVKLEDFMLGQSSLALGDELSFSFTVQAQKAMKVRLEYGVDYMKANGKQSRKIFQISEILLKAKEQRSYTKQHSFADVSVRKHYPGAHAISLIINGVQRGTLEFELE